MSGMTKQTYVRYWSGLVVFMKKRKHLPEDWDKAISDTTRQRVYTFPQMGDDVRISAGASPGIPSEAPYIQVDFTANPNPNGKSVFMRLCGQRGVINNEINSDPPVRWDIRGEKEESWARTRKYAVPQNEGDWDDQYEWFAETLVAFNEAFKKRI